MSSTSTNYRGLLETYCRKYNTILEWPNYEVTNRDNNWRVIGKLEVIIELLINYKWEDSKMKEKKFIEFVKNGIENKKETGDFKIYTITAVSENKKKAVSYYNVCKDIYETLENILMSYSIPLMNDPDYNTTILNIPENLILKYKLSKSTDNVLTNNETNVKKRKFSDSTIDNDTTEEVPGSVVTKIPAPTPTLSLQTQQPLPIVQPVNYQIPLANPVSINYSSISSLPSLPFPQLSPPIKHVFLLEWNSFNIFISEILNDLPNSEIHVIAKQSDVAKMFEINSVIVHSYPDELINATEFYLPLVLGMYLPQWRKTNVNLLLTTNTLFKELEILVNQVYQVHCEWLPNPNILRGYIKYHRNKLNL